MSESAIESAIRERARRFFCGSPSDSAEVIDVTLSEALVLGLLKQGVRKYFAIFGHGSTDLGEVLGSTGRRAVTRTSTAATKSRMAHAATALPGSTARLPRSSPRSGRARCRPWRARSPPPPTASASITSTVTRRLGRRLQHAAGPEGAAGLLRPDDRAAWDSPTCCTRRARCAMPAARDELRATIPTRRARSICCCRSTRSPSTCRLNLRHCRQRPLARWPCRRSTFDKAGDLLRRHPNESSSRPAAARAASEAVRRLAEAIGAAVVCRRDRPASAGRPSPEHACRRLQGLDQRQLRDGERRSG